MPDIRIVCVREDVALAEALVEALEEAGFSIDDAQDEAEFDDIGAGVVVLSHAALASPVFRVAAQQMMSAHKAVILNLTRSDVRRVAGDSDVVDFAHWDGEHDTDEMHALSEAVTRVIERRDEQPAAAPAPTPPQPAAPSARQQQPTPPPVRQQPEEPPTRRIVLEAEPQPRRARDDNDDDRPRRRGGVLGGMVGGLGAALLIASGLGAFAYYRLGLFTPSTPEAAVATVAPTEPLRRITAQEIGAVSLAQIAESIERIAPRALVPVSTTQTAAPTRTATTRTTTTPARTAATTTRRQPAERTTPRPLTNWDTTNPAAPTRRGPPT